MQKDALILFFRLKGGKHTSESSLLPRLKSKKTPTVSIEVLGVSMYYSSDTL
jgi:hypothetical protein